MLSLAADCNWLLDFVSFYCLIYHFSVLTAALILLVYSIQCSIDEGAPDRHGIITDLIMKRHGGISRSHDRWIWRRQDPVE